MQFKTMKASTRTISSILEHITLKTLSRQFLELLERYRVVRQCLCAVGLYADNSLPSPRSGITWLYLAPGSNIVKCVPLPILTQKRKRKENPAKYIFRSPKSLETFLRNPRNLGKNVVFNTWMHLLEQHRVVSILLWKRCNSWNYSNTVE